MKKNRKLVIWIGITVALLAAIVFCPFLIHHDPYKTDLSHSLMAPCKEYLFGTDNLGRCVLCRVIVGAKTSVFSALIVVAIVFAVGMTLGIVAGYLGGVVDVILMRITVIFQAFPGFILAICVAAMLGTGLRNGILSLSLVYWTTYAKLGRSMVLTIKEAEYVKAAKLCGADSVSIMRKYILPNVEAPLVVTAALDVGNVILSMAGLSFLGLGAARPTAEWGAMMSESRSFFQTGPWGILFPGLALLLVVIVFNCLGDAIADYINGIK